MMIESIIRWRDSFVQATEDELLQYRWPKSLLTRPSSESPLAPFGDILLLDLLCLWSLA